MQPLFIRSCHKDVILARKNHDCVGIVFAQGDSAGGSKLVGQTLRKYVSTLRVQEPENVSLITDPPQPDD